ncbi:MAG: hypothetical protein WCT44_02265 [Candidatus Paceibacterota bacterium]
MKNLNKIFVLILLVFPVLVFAAEFKAGQQPSFSSGEKAEENLYMAGGSVVSAGAAGEDLLVAGGTALVSGPVTGDLFVVGGNITVSNQVRGDARIGGGNIIVSGNVMGDALIGGGQIILSGKLIGGDAAIAGGAVRVDSEVKGNAKIAGGEVYINAPIGGDANIRAEKLTLGPNADIIGNLKYKGAKPVIIEEGGRVRGDTVFTQLSGRDKTNRGITAGVIGFFTFVFVAKFLMLFFTALLIGLGFKRYSRELVEKATENPLKELGRGVVTLIVLPVFSVFLLITVVGIPLGIIGFLSFAMLLVFASIITPIFLGALVYKWISKGSGYVVNWKTILLGTVVYFLLCLIPFIGWLAGCVSVAISLGAALGIKWKVAKEWR